MELTLGVFNRFFCRLRPFPPPRQAFDKSGLRVEFSLSKPDAADPSKSTISIAFSNTSAEVRISALIQEPCLKFWCTTFPCFRAHYLGATAMVTTSEAIITQIKLLC